MSAIKIFKPTLQSITEIKATTATKEKQLQNLFEADLDCLLGVRFLAREFRTADGRIDTLGLDRKKRPVVIEYKRHFDEKVINQGIHYLAWLNENKAEFKYLVMDKMGKKASKSIVWSTRLICVAAEFSRFAPSTARNLNHDIELIRYLNFGDDLLMLEFMSEPRPKPPRPNPLVVVKPTQGHKSGKSNDDRFSESAGKTKEHYEALISFLRGLGDDVEGIQRKHVIAFKRNNKNFASIKVLKSKLHVFPNNINPDDIELIKDFSTDMRNIGHHGTGDVRLTITSDGDFERAKPLIKKSYEAS